MFYIGKAAMEDLTYNHQDPLRQDFPVLPPPWKNSTSLRPDQYNRNKNKPLVQAAIQENRNTLQVELSEAAAKCTSGIITTLLLK